MWPNPQESTDFVIFTEEIPNEKFHFLCGAAYSKNEPFPAHVPIYFNVFQYSTSVASGDVL